MCDQWGETKSLEDPQGRGGWDSSMWEQVGVRSAKGMGSEHRGSHARRRLQVYDGPHRSDSTADVQCMSMDLRRPSLI